MRRLKLMNSRGEAFDLMRRDAFFSTPDGLGFDEIIESAQMGDQYIDTFRYASQMTLSGEMRFAGYGQYSEFIQFLTDNLVFLYCPYETWYEADCILQSIAKGEIDPASNELICSVSFTRKSLWHSDRTFIKSNPSVGDGKVYPYTYPYSYAEATAGDMSIQNIGTVQSSCVIHILGPVSNPRWALIKNGEIVADGAVTAEIAEGRKIVIDSDPAKLEIAEYTVNNTYVRDLYQHSNFSTARFLMIPPGNSILRVLNAGAAEVNAYVEVRQSAKTV